MKNQTPHDAQRQLWALQALQAAWMYERDAPVTIVQYPLWHPVDAFVVDHDEERVTDFVEVKGCNKEPSAVLPLWISEAKVLSLRKHQATVPTVSGAWVVWAFRDHARLAHLDYITKEIDDYRQFGRSDRGREEMEYGYRVPYVATIGIPYNPAVRK